MKRSAERNFQIVLPVKNMDFRFDEQIEKIFDCIFEFYGILLPEGKVLTLAGKIFEKTFTDPKHLTGHLFADTVFWQTSDKNYRKIQDSIKKAQTGEVSKKVLEFRISAIENKLVELSLCPVLTDIDKVKQIFVSGQIISEEQLARAYVHEKKVRDEVEEANRTKDHFLALVSHELRTPLNAILGWTKILLQKQVDEKTRRNALETIERSAISQAKLLSDLVDSARIASGRLRLEMRPMNLYGAIKTVFLAQKPQADEKNIKLNFECDAKDIPVFGDLIRIQQIFSNLLSNALKYTNPGGNVWINVRTEKSRTIISIKDDGKGINADYLPKIFRQFSQGEEAISRQEGGLGLGLSIVKILVEKHHGIVTARSDGKDLGAEFMVELPLYISITTSDSEKLSGKLVEPKSLANLKILIVEDDDDSREVLHYFLEQKKARVISVPSAQEALKLFENPKGTVFDAIISDLGMPNGNGYSLISKIRNFPPEKGGQIPALALSAFTAKENIENAYTAGFQKYHTKPFDPDLLVRDILGLISKNEKS